MGLFFDTPEEEQPPDPEPEREPLTEEQEEELVAEATDDMDLDPGRAFDGEDLTRIVNRLIDEMGLGGEVAFLLYDTQVYDVVLKTSDVMVISKTPSSSAHVQMPHAEELMALLAKERSENGDGDEEPEES